MNYLLSDMVQLTLRHLRTQIRMRVWLVINLVQPIIWLVLFTQVFKSFSNIPGVGGESYLQFFTPGVIVMTVLFGSAWSGMGVIFDMDMGIMAKMMATPVTRFSIVMSSILSSMVVLVGQALVIFAIAVIMGVHVATGGPGVLLTIVLVCLLGLGFSGFSNGLALLLKRQEPLIGIVNFVALPTVFLSSAMMPGNLLPHWLDVVRHYNPVDYAIVGVRDLVLNGYVWSDLWLALVVLAAWGTVGVVFASMMLRTQENG